MTDTRTVRVEILSRVEGEGALHIETRQGRLERVELQIYEPPRLFESLLRGRPLEETPDITARICGICPVAYQMTAVHALERALGVQVSPEIRRLRRLLYCGEWIESHALHMHLLHAPDFLGYDSGLAMAADHPLEVNRGLRLKKHGNQLLEVLGGRAIHPINVAVGGFHRAPRREALQRLIPDFEWGLQAAIEATRWVATFRFPDYCRDYHFVALRHPDEYPFNEGCVASSRGELIDVGNYEEHFAEVHVPHSTALHSETQPDGGCYHVGPLARIALNRDRLLEPARRLADELGFETPCGNPYRSIVARGLELVQAYAEALQILRDYRDFRPHRMSYAPREGTGCAATEAPRGLIFHRYQITGDGLIEFAKIVPPTSQNQKQIEDDLRDWLPGQLELPDAELARRAEELVRNYDPCISCSTHFLKVHRHDR
ncbi:MAG: Ni/Fe hydrogenase subunit alpha [Planctomycetaceae bacterium]|jgi:coenzyme F420-reducing hydrogenase alpha subunit